MPPDRWQQISQVYHAALTREESERMAFVREACAGDEALRREVESLLGHVSGAAGFLSTPAVAIAGSALSDSQPTTLPTADGPHRAPKDSSRPEPGQRFGPYRIERLLGRGGISEVYEAEHLDHGRRIALKVESAVERSHGSRAISARRPTRRLSEPSPHRLHL
jgi:eukaryotic-like serine/threonine-protein kinase